MINNPKTLILLTILVWSFGPSFGKILSDKSQFLLLAITFTFTLITMSIYFLKTEKNISSKIKKTKPMYFLVGLTGYFLYWIFFFQSMRAYAEASTPTVLNYTFPIFTIILTNLLFNKTKRSFLFRFIEGAGLSIGILGVAVLATQGNISSFNIFNLEGLLWGIATGLSYGFFSSYSSTVKKEDHSIFLLSSIFASWILMAIFSFSELYLLSTFTIKEFLAAAALGILPDGIGYITWTKSNSIARRKKIDISKIASLVFFLPITSSIVIALFFGENNLLQPYFIISIILVAISSFICQRATNIKKFFSKE
jgi:drug/metabolite transporter (DMT)-like permease